MQQGAAKEGAIKMNGKIGCTFLELLLEDYRVFGFCFATERLWKLQQQNKMEHWEATFWWNRLHELTKHNAY